MPDTSASRRAHARAVSGRCTFPATSGRKVGTTFTGNPEAASVVCQSSGSAGSSVVPTSATFIRRRMPRAVRGPVASWRLASVQIFSAVLPSSRSSMPKWRRSSRCVQWNSGFRSVCGTVSAQAWNFSHGVAAPVIRSSPTPSARIARHL